MRLIVFSHKPCWRSSASPTGVATDGGFPFQMAALAELFDATRVAVPVSSRGPRPGEIPLVSPRLHVVPLTARHGADFTSKLSFLPWLLWNSRVILRELFRAEAVHTPIPGDVGTVGLLGAWLLRKRLLVRHCGDWEKRATASDKFWRWFMERFAGGRNVMLATGQVAAPPSSKNPNIHWVFATSLRETEIRELANRKTALDPKRLRLITVGRQDGGKGTEVLIRSLPLVQKRFPQAALDVVGDGSDLPNLKRSTEEMGLNGKVTFHGKVNHGEVIRRLQGAHLFCFPTHSEGFPKAVLEALACGLPVIASPVSAIPVLLANGGGILTRPEPAAFAAAVCELAASPDHYRSMSAKARETAKEYTLERWRDTIEKHLTATWGPLKAQKLRNQKAENKNQELALHGR